MNAETRMESGQGDDMMLANAQMAITNLTAQVSRAYEDLKQRDDALKQHEEQVRDREARAAQTLSDAQREAMAIVERAQRQRAERDWLNDYAQRLTGIAAELERTMAEPAAPQGYGIRRVELAGAQHSLKR